MEQTKYAVWVRGRKTGYITKNGSITPYIDKAMMYLDKDKAKEKGRDRKINGTQDQVKVVTILITMNTTTSEVI
jgi:hypothetical protein